MFVEKINKLCKFLSRAKIFPETVETILPFLYYMNMNKIFTAAVLSATLCAAAFAADFTDYENSLVKQVLQIKLDSRMYKTNESALAFVQGEHQKMLNDGIQSKLSDEAKLTLDNFFVLEEYHFMWEMTPEDPEIAGFILRQFDKVIAWNSAHDVSGRNGWYNLSAYDLINSTMPHLKQGKSISLGLEEKKVYDSMIQNGPESGLLYINAGLWYYFAPAIGGGSNAKAISFFRKAAEVAGSPYEKYFALVYLSQSEFDKNDSASCEKHLAEAEEVFPGSYYIETVRYMNKAGCSVLDYANNRKKVDGKVAKFYAGNK